MLFTLSSIIGTVGAAVVLATFLTAQANKSIHWMSTLAFIGVGGVFVGVVYVVFHPAM
jgi:hypothetical protein